MDPNATLTRIRDAVSRIEGMTALLDDAAAYESAAEELTGAFRDLDEWLGKGNFAPDAWLRPQASLLNMQKRAYRLRSALRDAGVSEQLVRAIELDKGST